MQQQQYHACNNSNITYATAVISRMQQQQYHACNNSNITHATAAVSRMQISLMQYHSCNGGGGGGGGSSSSSSITHTNITYAITLMQYHTCNDTHAITCMQITHAICAISHQN